MSANAVPTSKSVCLNLFVLKSRYNEKTNFLILWLDHKE
jgi:hypothetical protein